MKTSWDKFLIITLTILVVFILYIFKKDTVERIEGTPSLAHSAEKFFDQDLFYKGIIQSEKEPKINDSSISGAIIPHHLLASFMMANLFKNLSKQKIQTIILIGPNHYEEGNFKVLTSLYDWQTSFGILKNNNLIINSLINQNLAKVDEDVLANEHSIGNLLPFIKFYLPNTRVVPLILSHQMTLGDTKILAERLSKFVNENSVLIASVDFSHYLTSVQAEEKDKVTLKAIENLNYEKLFALNNDYLDSPASLTALLITMQKIKKTKPEILYHTNSGLLLKDNTAQTTSYFSIIF